MAESFSGPTGLPAELGELAESTDLEVKKAQGISGQGEVPRDFWETYAAMANTDGGTVFLGIQEKPKGQFTVLGLRNVSQVQKQLWDCLNDRDKISANLLTNSMVEVVNTGDGLQVLRIRVPRAGRHQRPVHLGRNPFGGTYRRNHEGDYLCDDETVRRMLAERVEDTRDARLLEHFTLADLETDTLSAYRVHFRTTRPAHPWCDLPDLEFLRSLGGWARDRESGREGLTLAGLLMFGRLRSILEALPYYIVDYQERPEPKAEARWVDRVTTDGTWSGNLYDFFRRVYPKLVAELKIPFRLEGVVRKDETHVHEALREALVNCLIHADYSGRVPLLVVKRPDLFGFRNPGTMRVPVEDAIRGGMTDCRNRTLQKMFQLVGFGEQAGSGVPKIFTYWREQHWLTPNFQERRDPDQTILELRMVSLFPTDVVRELDRRFGDVFRNMPELQRLAMATVAAEGQVTHSRLMTMTTEHPREVSKSLRGLCQTGLLESDGVGRGMHYFFPGEPTALEGEDFLSQLGESRNEAEPAQATEGLHKAQSSVHNDVSSVHSEPGPVHSEPSSVHRLKGVDKELEEIAEPVRSAKRTPPELLRETILALCSRKELTLSELAGLLNRSAPTLRIHYLGPMTKNGTLELKYPDKPSHPHQAYKTRSPVSVPEAPESAGA